MTSRHAILLASFVLLAACAPIDADLEVDDLSGAEGKADDLGPARTYVANHCEVFVDKAAVLAQTASTSTWARLYIKTLNDRLDGPIVGAGFEGRASVCLSCNVSESGGPTVHQPLHVEAERFLGSSDYFVLDLPLEVTIDRNRTFAVEGVLYVETEAGTRYTTRSSPDDVLRLDASSRFELDLGDGRAPVDTLRTTGSRFPGDPTRELFNPGGCF